MKSEKGQSLVEIIFSVGVISLVIVGVVSLIVNVVGVKNASLKRKMANELGEIVIEDLLDEKLKTPEVFWQLSDIDSPQVLNGFDGYSYTIDFTQITGGGCRDDVADCAQAVINITWDNGESDLSINRFFSRRI